LPTDCKIFAFFDSIGLERYYLGGITALTVYRGNLYASTLGGGGTGAQIWRCQTCDSQGSWQKVADNGFGNGFNSGMSALEVFNDYLYFVVGNSQTGMEVWRTADGTSWQQVGFAGFGNSNNYAPYWDNSVTVFNNAFVHWHAQRRQRRASVANAASTLPAADPALTRQDPSGFQNPKGGCISVWGQIMA
jgi:hypothetical protein